MRHARTPRIFSLICLTLICCGCSLVADVTTILVRLPVPPHRWEAAWGRPGYRVQWRADSRQYGEIRTPPGTEAVTLDIPRSPVVVLLAWAQWESGGPRLAAGEDLRPAGAVVSPHSPGGPRDGDSGGMLLAFEAGPLAFVLSEAARHGVQISRFNHRRLGFEIAGRLPDDPWQLDTAGIIEALCAGSMRVSLVRPVEVFDAVLDVPEGLWVPASPFRPPIAGGRQTVQGPKGITPYYADTGRRMIMEIADGGAWCLISPPDSQVFPEP